MAKLEITNPQESPNLAGITTIQAPLATVLAAYADPRLFAQRWGRVNPMQIHRVER